MKQNINGQLKIAKWLLNHTLDKQDRDYVIGDFEEIYIGIREESGTSKAWTWYWWQVLKSIPHFINNFIYWRIVMFRNYLKIAIRNIKRHKGYSFINIAGLTLGMTFFILILLWIQDELSYDRYHEKATQIYRVISEGNFGTHEFKGASSPAPLAEALSNEFREVVQVARLQNFFPNYEVLIRYKDRQILESGFLYADSTIFDVFTIPLIKGNPKTALVFPNSIVISLSTARKYFGNENPIGKALTIENDQDYQITGVTEDIPRNSHFHFDFLASLSTLNNSKSKNWLNLNHHTYIVLKKDYPPEQLEAKLSGLVLKYVGPLVQAYLGISIEEFYASGQNYKFYLQPLTEIHLHSNLKFELESNGDISYIYIFAFIAFFILLIACINFMNLATARSAGRAKEIGVRKVMGSLRSQLIKQFLSESIFMSLIAIYLAIVLANLLLPYFNNLSEKQLELDYFSNWLILPALLAIALFVGVLAGIYPALYLASFQPENVLKGKLRMGFKSSTFRNSLVVFQFTLSIILFIGTFVVYDQLHYIRNKKLGFNKEHIVVIPRAWTLGQQWNVFKHELLQHPNVINATISNALPGKIFPSNLFQREGASTEDVQIIYMLYTDCDFTETFQLELATGRKFPSEISKDYSYVILNEAAVNVLDLDNPIGKNILESGRTSYNVIGVVKDFHFESLHHKIKPIVILPRAKKVNNQSARILQMNYVSVRINMDDVAETLTSLKDTWNKFVPQQPFEHYFYDEDFNRLYNLEQRTGKLFSIFSILAIFIACMGLFGLAAFAAEQRTKEIGVRKVFGASVSNIVILLSMEFIKWIAWANIIAWPVAYFMMDNWLQDFAYCVQIDFKVFVFSTSLAMVIALLTVSYQAIKAAKINPAYTLKYE